jgi:glycosyltransferase involved in cell wall biosynthesis
VPTKPDGPKPENLTIRIGVDDIQVQQGLQQASILFLPADYESFGFAQAEALLAGCCVPVLGEWPLWLDVPELDWLQFSPEQQAQALKQLITNPDTLRRLGEQQVNAWRRRPERMAPMLPLITNGTTLH